MRLYLADQAPRFAQHLEALKQREVARYDPALLRAKSSSIPIDSNLNIAGLDTSFLFDYDIFPRKILIGQGEWQIEKRAMQPGDTIVQQIFIPPVSFPSQKVIVGVRVKEVFKDPNRIGFSYETLEGHVETGISSFFLEQADNGLTFRIETHSAPGNFFTRLLGPIFTAPYQAYCTGKALSHVKQLLERQKVVARL